MLMGGLNLGLHFGYDVSGPAAVVGGRVRQLAAFLRNRLGDDATPFAKSEFSPEKLENPAVLEYVSRASLSQVSLKQPLLPYRNF